MPKVSADQGGVIYAQVSGVAITRELSAWPVPSVWPAPAAQPFRRLTRIRSPERIARWHGSIASTTASSRRYGRPAVGRTNRTRGAVIDVVSRGNEGRRTGFRRAAGRASRNSGHIRTRNNIDGQTSPLTTGTGRFGPTRRMPTRELACRSNSPAICTPAPPLNTHLSDTGRPRSTVRSARRAIRARRPCATALYGGRGTCRPISTDMLPPTAHFSVALQALRPPLFRLYRALSFVSLVSSCARLITFRPSFGLIGCYRHLLLVLEILGRV
jgi:hypothetical protein